MEGIEDIKLIFWIGTSVMISLALGLISISLYYQNQLSKEKRKESENILKSAAETEKKERERIAKDLHDGISGDLNSIKNYLTILKKRESNPDNLFIYHEIKEGVEHALTNIKYITYNLMPPLLEKYGFKDAIIDYFSNISTKNNINFNTLFEGWELNISDQLSYELFRILQEFATNQVKHGHPENVFFIFKVTNKQLEIDIKDNGKKYSFFEEFETSKGNGLINIYSRIKTINGTLVQHPTTEGNHLILTVNL